jgi:hypothetical protein
MVGRDLRANIDSWGVNKIDSAAALKATNSR